ncbi:hypothetical protein ACIOHO_40575 [Streptomyces sp. NPDC087849]|uniref:hypothetical protein n=1 Tax=Streptomyces sp. NPDC087849 TaxID=3365808 RepID=UPI0038293531
MPTYDFPQDLRDAQFALHQTRAAYEQHAKTLPWSAEPMPGWEGEKQLHSGYRSGKSDSPGYTEEQAAEVADFQARLLELMLLPLAPPDRAVAEGLSARAGRLDCAMSTPRAKTMITVNFSCSQLRTPDVCPECRPAPAGTRNAAANAVTILRAMPWRSGAEVATRPVALLRG